jgi:cytochrome c-type biogenesis protein CcmH/NrfG
MSTTLCIPFTTVGISFDKRSINKIRKTVKNNPSDVEARVHLALALLDINQFEEASIECHNALDLCQENSRSNKRFQKDTEAAIRYFLGLALLGQGERQAARLEWEKVISLSEALAQEAKKALGRL